ncbi:hypothetical protein COMA2_130021 [Candidatus Nitrospira nitrificans]|uniref:Uncharacterized protein n=1 Tax=Candidatus Nitrospira nitrificans TaxID=1742973 RepID=A0A0S4L9S2_9BACT|nr:hypothetical protein COMA2_130021 [Candidatus Nitrospira nitrificans]
MIGPSITHLPWQEIASLRPTGKRMAQTSSNFYQFVSSVSLEE